MTTAPCTHVRVHHPHGSDSRYRSDGCRCEPCTTAHARYERVRRLRDVRGIKASVPIGPVRRHVIELIASGMSARGIARQAGVALLTVRKIEDGKQASVRTVTAAKIRNLQPAILDHARVQSIGASRRLQALATLGWSAPAIASLIGVHPDTVKRITAGTAYIEKDTDDAVRALYRKLVTTPATGNPSALGRTRAWAARNGWAGPMDWEDIDTDEAPQFSAPYKPAKVPDQARELLDMGLNDDEISARLGIKPATVRYYLTRRAAA